MIRLTEEKGLSFDDVLLVPQYSEVRTRRNVDLSTSLIGTESSKAVLSIPIIAANMDTVCGPKMALAMAKVGAVGVLHRGIPLEERFSIGVAGVAFGVAFGVNEDLDLVINRANENKISLLVLDIAHGHSKHALEALEKVANGLETPHVTLVGGNVATAQGVTDMANAGATTIKVGIGPGSACSTRIVTGTGVPQLTAISQCADRADEIGVSIIADGGIKISGDIAKALGAGADAVMLGNMLAGTNETPGDMVVYEGKTYKEYRGMASKEAGSTFAEGVSGMVEAKGPVTDVLNEICKGLVSALSYSGASNLKEFAEKSLFIESAHSSTVIRESAPHDIVTSF
jgi:IMP dehydrogenase